MNEKYGFIYVWYNRWKKKFYVGCHWGREDDGYVCSSKLMREAYKRNPEYFKRRVVQRVYVRELLLTEEHKWLSQIKDEQLGKKFYNLNKHHFGHWSTASDLGLSVREKLSKANKGRVVGPFSEDHKKKISEALKGKPLANETKQKLSDVRKGKPKSEEFKQKCRSRVMSEETKLKIKNSLLGRKHSEEAKERMRLAR